MTPEEEARRALHCGATRDALSPAAQAEYDRLLALVTDSITVTTTFYEIAGPMGRAYLMLPCRHQRASLADPYSNGPQATRKCLRCGSRYQITLNLGTGSAQVVKL